jgi:hypothetical protein
MAKPANQAVFSISFWVSIWLDSPVWGSLEQGFRDKNRDIGGAPAMTWLEINVVYSFVDTSKVYASQSAGIEVLGQQHIVDEIVARSLRL